MKKHCDQLEPLIEAIADGSIELLPEQSAHLASCDRCAARLERARAIEQLLSLRDVASPSANFTQRVMAEVVHERWQAERVIDIGFNLAMAAGVFVIIAGALGLAWSLGLLTITIDVDAIAQALGEGFTGRVLSQVQTVAMAAVLLTIALALWWWAEAASD
jgi:anti-sigma factor RsiW